jgi:hypothetical protein
MAHYDEPKPVIDRKEILAKARAKAQEVMEAKRAQKPTKKAPAKPKPEPVVVPEPVRPTEPINIPKAQPRPVKVEEATDSEPEIIEEIIVKKRKKPKVVRKVIYETASESEEEPEPEPIPQKPKPRARVKREPQMVVADPVASMTKQQIQQDLRKIQMDMLTRSLFGGL